MLPAEVTKSLLSSYHALPHLSTQQVLLGGRGLTPFQQERTAARRKRSKVFSPQTSKYGGRDASWVNNTVEKSKAELSLDPRDSKAAQATTTALRA